MGGVCSMRRNDDTCIRTLIGKFDGKGLLGRRNRKWENNIKTNVKGIGARV